MRHAFVLALAVGCSGPKQAAPPPDPHAGHHGHHMGSAAPPPTANATQGAYLKIACAPAAQAEFDRGFFFLHNMDYVSAKKTFEAAATAHAGCAMLHWGVAMSYFQPLWPGQATKDSLAKGSAAVARAQAASASASAIEKAFIAAVAAFYTDAEKVDTPMRYENWEAGQRLAASAHPDDVEAQAFWALSRLATVDRKDKTYRVTLEVAAKLEELLQKRPEHPGLLHYLLHAYDNPVHANKAIGVPRPYEAVAPEAAHALHMPSHIHVRLGNWQDVIDWNIKSAAAALKHPVEGRISRDWLHATDYMVYGYLQIADDVKAKEAAGKIDPKTRYELNSG